MKEKDWNGNKKTTGASNHSEKERINNNTQEDMKNIAEYIDYLEQENAELKIQRDYYKREYSLYNKTLEEAGKALTKK